MLYFDQILCFSILIIWIDKNNLTYQNVFFYFKKNNYLKVAFWNVYIFILFIYIYFLFLRKLDVL